MAAYRAPAGESRAEIREKGSRFLAIVGPAADEAAAKVLLEALARRHPDATHHCWAWRLGEPPRERSADAGEPAGAPAGGGGPVAGAGGGPPRRPHPRVVAGFEYPAPAALCALSVRGPHGGN